VHAVESGITIAGFVLKRGESITLTAAQVADTVDRDGNSFLDLSDDDQLARWGSVKFGQGPAPEGMAAWQDDSLARSDAREAARADALRIVDRGERIAALKAIDDKFGRPTEQWSLAEYPEHR